MKYIFLLIAFLLIVPMLWMISLSFQDIGDILKMPPRLIPRMVTLSSYKFIARNTLLLRWAFNSMVIVMVTLVVQLSVTICGGWGFAAYRFRGRKVLAWIFIGAMLIPVYSLLISRFVLIVKIGLYDTWWPMFTIGAFTPAGIIVFTKFCAKIPEGLPDSARMDGASELRILFQIILPQAMPLIGFMTIVGFVGNFSELMWPMLLLQDRAKFPLFYGLIKFGMELENLFGAGSAMNTVGIEQAIASILLIPPVIIFILCRKTFRKKFIQGGIKE